MLSSIFDSSTIPVLEQVVNFAQARHGVLAGNIANMDTPGYKTRDISPQQFQAKLKEAVEQRHSAAKVSNNPMISMSSLGSNRPEATSYDSMKEVRESIKSILFHDDSDVSIEQQVAEISKNQGMHNLALSLMTAQFRLLKSAISERP